MQQLVTILCFGQLRANLYEFTCFFPDLLTSHWRWGLGAKLQKLHVFAWHKLYKIIWNHLVVASPHENQVGFDSVHYIKFMLRCKLQAHPKLNVSYFKGDFQFSLKFEAKRPEPSYPTFKNIFTTFPNCMKTLPHRCSKSGPKRPW